MNYYLLSNGGFASEAELYHHGIKGMKWGVRRYQNRDGTLTAAGKKRYTNPDGTLTNEGKEIVYGAAKNILGTEANRRSIKIYEDEKQTSITKAGIKNNNDSDMLQKGSTLTRIANSGESLDSKRKYVSLTDSDAGTYYDMWEYLPIDMSKPVSQYIYKANKDLKIVTGEKVVRDLLDTYGNETLKQFDKDVKEIGYNPTLYIVPDKKGRKEMKQWYMKYPGEAEAKVRTFLKDTLSKHMDEISAKYIKEGYDAIVDAEDWYGDVEIQYPMILLNPKESVSVVREIDL